MLRATESHLHFLSEEVTELHKKWGSDLHAPSSRFPFLLFSPFQKGFCAATPALVVKHLTFRFISGFSTACDTRMDCFPLRKMFPVNSSFSPYLLFFAAASSSIKLLWVSLSPSSFSTLSPADLIHPHGSVHLHLFDLYFTIYILSQNSFLSSTLIFRQSCLEFLSWMPKNCTRAFSVLTGSKLVSQIFPFSSWKHFPLSPTLPPMAPPSS